MPLPVPNASFTITRANLATPAADLVISARRGVTPLRVYAVTEPAVLPTNDLAPPSPDVNADILLATHIPDSAWILGVKPDAPANEAAARVLLRDLRTAITAQWTYSLIVTMNGAPAESYVCKPGGAVPGQGRSYNDLVYANPEWILTLPCYPIPVVA